MKKLLVIENDARTLDMIGYIFVHSGFKVVESLKKISVSEIDQLNPNIVVIDYLLSDGFGSDLCLEIKSNPHTNHLPVILYSASSKIEQVAHDSCADAFIAKPFDLDYFVRMVNNLAL